VPLFESVRKLLNFNDSTGFLADTVGRGVTWSTGAALQPILPPSVVLESVSEQDALKCPPVDRAIGLYSAAMLHLDWNTDAVTKEWLTRSTGPVPAKLRDVDTLVDLIIHNRSLWVLSRDGLGRPYEAVHLPVTSWMVNAEGVLIIGGKPVGEADMKSIIIFRGAKRLSLLEAAQDTLLHYKDMTLTIKDRAANPMAMQELKLLEDYDGARPGDPDYEEQYDEALNAQKAYAKARRATGGAVTVTPRNIDLKVHQANDDGAMLIDARNAVRLDVANHCNINAAMLDGNNGTSDTYSNTLQNVNEFAALSLALFTDPIALRLSMPDLALPGSAEVPLVKFTELDVIGGEEAKGNAGTAVGTPQIEKAGLEPIA
jgi:hypothetical protein